MNKFVVTITLSVVADDISKATNLGYDLVYYGRDNAEGKSGGGYIDHYVVDFGDDRGVYE